MGAQIFVRGIRSWEKDGQEERKLQILNTWGPLVLGPLWWPLLTIFVQGTPEYNHVSSTLIRSICAKQQSVNQSNDQNNNKVKILPKTNELDTLVPLCLVDDVTRLYGVE
jgi:phosphopantetheine adenylyltransferase